MNWNERIKSIQYKRLAIGILLGGIGGYLYYYYVGCASGTCAITADPINSTLYGMLIGGTFFYRETRKGKAEEKIKK